MSYLILLVSVISWGVIIAGISAPREKLAEVAGGASPNTSTVAFLIFLNASF